MRTYGDVLAIGKLSANVSEIASTDVANLTGLVARLTGGTSGVPSYVLAQGQDFVIDEDGSIWVYVNAATPYWSHHVAGSGIIKYAKTIGDGSTTTFVINHNFGTSDISSVFVYELSSGDHQTQVDIAIVDANNITVTFATPPALDDYRVIITG